MSPSPSVLKLLCDENVPMMVNGLLEKKGFSRSQILGAYLITPSCGVGSLPVELAEKIIVLTQAVSVRIAAG